MHWLRMKRLISMKIEIHKVTAWLKSPVTRLSQFANFHDIKNYSAEGYFYDKILAAICWCNEMSGTGRRSGWPLSIHGQHMLCCRVEGTTFPVLTTISNLIIIKTSSVTFINPTRVWILEDLQNRAHHMLPFCTRLVLWTKTEKLIKTMACWFDFF